MKRTITNVKVVVCLFLIPFISSCVDHERDLYKEREKLTKEQYFDFNMNQSVAVDIDYSFQNFQKGEDYIILFEIYKEYPFVENTEDDSRTKKGIEPIYRAATDAKGKFHGTIDIPSDLSEVWLSSDYLGTVSPVKLTLGDDHRIYFNQNEYIQSLLEASDNKSRGITAANHKYLDDWTVLPGVDWDDKGRPTNLSPEVNIPPANVLYNVKEVFKKAAGKDIKDNYPQFFDGTMTSDVPIVKPTKVSLVFINSSASWHNTVGYYTYPSNETPTAENIKKILAFPNASPIGKSNGIGSLICGEEVQLMYWDEKEGIYKEEFPAGITIGWCLQGMGFKTNTENSASLGDIVKGMGIRYSTTSLNKDGRQRTVSLRDEKSGHIVAIGFEDNTDFDYRDALFYIHTSEKDAVDETLPPLPETPGAPSDEENYVSHSGMLTFEDLWPDEGDYDMNDVMIKYTSKVYKNVLTNKVFKIVDTFLPYHKGGYLANGFGYQLHNISLSEIGKVTIERPSYAPTSHYMTGDTEDGQSHPTILLFDNMNIFDGREETEKTYTVTIEKLKDVDEKLVLPPYNPFIFINSNETRGKEVHLVKYPPTDKVDPSFFGIGRDDSRPEEELYYVSKDLMPFALNMPVNDFPIPAEGERIDVSYPKFASWVKSEGKQNKDWYKHPKK